MKTIIIPSNISLKLSTRYMKRMQSQGYDCWFKTIANKDKGELEVHIIVENPVYTFLPQLNYNTTKREGKHNGK